MMDPNQVWDVQQAIDYAKKLKSDKTMVRDHGGKKDGCIWIDNSFTSFSASDAILGHAAIRKALKPHGIGVVTEEHAHNRMVFRRLLQG